MNTMGGDLLQRPALWPPRWRANGIALLLSIAAMTAIAASPTFAATADCDSDCRCPSAPPACETCRRPQDQVWLLDARQLGCLDDAPIRDLQLGYSQYDPTAGQWKPSDDAAFSHGPGAKLPTVVWVHGDRMSDDNAYVVGLRIYQSLVRGRCDAPPLRFVIWSWPTARVYRSLLKDVRLKAERVGASSVRLAWVLNRLDPQLPVSLVGYSFGARVLAGTLHLLGGGTLEGHRLEGLGPGPHHYRVVLLASAIDYDSLEPNELYGRALGQVDSLLLLNNPCDRILARYHRLPCGGGGPPALGYEGLADLKALGAGAAKIRQVDAGPYVGRRHALNEYVESPTMVAEIRNALPVARVAIKAAN